MGQRFQTVVSCETYRHTGGDTTRSARHLQWCYGVNAVIRAAQAVEFAQTLVKVDKYAHDHPGEVVTGLYSMFCVNRFSGNVQGLHPDYDVTEWLDKFGSKAFDNNNGMFLLEFHAHALDLMQPEEKHPNSFSFGFTIGGEDGGDNKTVVGVNEYLERFADELERCGSNMEAAEALSHAVEVLRQAEKDGLLMTQEQADRVTGPRDGLREATTFPTAEEQAA